MGLAISPPAALAATTFGQNITTTGNLTVDGALKFTSGAVANYILTTDASGNATWITVGTALGNSDTDSLPEGVTNKYYDPTDVDSRTDVRITLQKGAISGLAELDGAGKVPTTQLPALAISNVYVVANIAARALLTVETGDVAIVLDAGAGAGDSRSYIYDGAVWQELLYPTNLYLSIANNLSDLSNPAAARTNLGLGNVEDVALSTWAGSANITTLGTISSAAGNVSLWINDAGYLTAEADPIFTASAASGILAGDITNWNTAYGWGNHALAGYLTAEVDPAAVLKATFAANGDLLVGTGAGTYSALTAGGGNNGKVLTVSGGVPTWQAPAAVVETDPVAGAVTGIIKSNGAGVFSAVADNSANWNTAFGWGNHALAGYLTAETDSVFTAWDKSTGISITESQISDLQAYLTAEIDPAAVLKATFAANGDLLVGTGAGTYSALTAGVGNNGKVLTVAAGVPAWSAVSYTETDPVAGAVTGIIKSNGAGVFSAIADNSANWNTAFGWGNHALAGYLTAESDPAAVLKATFAANGDLLIGTGAGTYSALAAGVGNNGKALIVSGGVPAWTSILTMPAGTTDNSTLRYNSGTSTWQENANFLASSAGTLTIAAGQSYTGTGAVTLSSGAATALTITGNAASTWSTSSGALTVDSAAGLNLGTTNATSLSVGRAAATFALASTGLNVSTGGALTGVASIDTISTSATALTFAGAGTIKSGGTSALTVDTSGAAALNLGTTNATSVSIGRSGQNTAINGTATIGGGSTITGIRFGTCAVDPPNIAANNKGTATCTATGVTTSDRVFVSAPNALENTLVPQGATASAADTITISLQNTQSLAAVNGASLTWAWFAIR